MTNKSQLDSEKLTGIDRDLSRITEEIKQIEGKLELETANAENLEKNKQAVLESLKKEEGRLTEKIEAYNDITEKSLKLSEKIENSKNRMYALHSTVSAKRSEARSTESYKESLLKRKNQIISETEAIEKNNKAFKETEKKATELQEKNAALVSEISEKLEHIKAEKGKVKEAEINLSAQCEDIKIKGSQLAARKKTIEEMETTMKDTTVR